MINRLLGIIYILMDRGTVTATELAERFEVSVRTIYRDVEHLSMAGIPVYARKGKNGGISLTERFVLDKMLLSPEEQQKILAALISLQETDAQENEDILRKLGDFFQTEATNWVAIDFSDWSGRRKDLFGQLREAILGRHVLTFDYYGQYGEMSSRSVEPVQLLFKEYTWYLRAYCRKRQAMRLFKVLRMKRVQVMEERFEISAEQRGKMPVKLPEGMPVESVSQNDLLEGNKEVQEAVLYDKNEKSMVCPEIVFQVDKKEAYRIYDRFEEEEITVLPNGDFQIRIKYPLDDWTYGLILSFGPSAKVLEPEWVRTEIAGRIRKMLGQYGE